MLWIEGMDCYCCVKEPHLDRVEAIGRSLPLVPDGVDHRQGGIQACLLQARYLCFRFYYARTLADFC